LYWNRPYPESSAPDARPQTQVALRRTLVCLENRGLHQASDVRSETGLSPGFSRSGRSISSHRAVPNRSCCATLERPIPVAPHTLLHYTQVMARQRENPSHARLQCHNDQEESEKTKSSTEDRRRPLKFLVADFFAGPAPGDFH